MSPICKLRGKHKQQERNAYPITNYLTPSPLERHNIPPNLILSDEEKEVLSLGLDFALPSINVNFVKYFLNFERLCNLLKSCSLYGDSSINMIFNKIATVAGDSYRKVCKQSKELKGNKVVENRMKILKDLKEDSSIHITKPDKGREVVV